MFGETPEALERFAMLSQASQAEAVKFFIENVRLHKWRKTGIIWWNMLDCWPQISDAVVDYYFHRKLAFHYIRRVQQPFASLLPKRRTGITRWCCATIRVWTRRFAISWQTARRVKRCLRVWKFPARTKIFRLGASRPIPAYSAC